MKKIDFIEQYIDNITIVSVNENLSQVLTNI